MDLDKYPVVANNNHVVNEFLSEGPYGNIKSLYSIRKLEIVFLSCFWSAQRPCHRTGFLLKNTLLQLLFLFLFTAFTSYLHI